MAEELYKGPITGWETAPEIYAEQVVGINTFEQSVLVTLAVNRIEPGKETGARSARVCVARLALPLATAIQLNNALNNVATAVALDNATAVGSHNN